MTVKELIKALAKFENQDATMTASCELKYAADDDVIIQMDITGVEYHTHPDVCWLITVDGG